MASNQAIANGRGGRPDPRRHHRSTNHEWHLTSAVSTLSSPFLTLFFLAWLFGQQWMTAKVPRDLFCRLANSIVNLEFRGILWGVMLSWVGPVELVSCETQLCGWVVCQGSRWCERPSWPLECVPPGGSSQCSVLLRAGSSRSWGPGQGTLLTHETREMESGVRIGICVFTQHHDSILVREQDGDRSSGR